MIFFCAIPVFSLTLGCKSEVSNVHELAKIEYNVSVIYTLSVSWHMVHWHQAIENAEMSHTCSHYVARFKEMLQKHVMFLLKKSGSEQTF